MERKRLLLPGFVSPELCKELIFIQKSCGVVGYRPHVFSTTLSHLVATNSAALIMPFIALREKVKEAVEEFFGCEFELFVEFTGLISWRRGANIGWHSDDNRDYLRQRHFSAVCYLNTHDQDFYGGLFHFQDGEPTTVVPTMGTVLIYSADEENVHCVNEVTDGERITLALWFTRNSSHDEDKKLLDQLANVMARLPVERGKLSVSLLEELRVRNAGISSPPSQGKQGLEVNPEDQSFPGSQYGNLVTANILTKTPLHLPFVPLPASTNMYWVSESKVEPKLGQDVGDGGASGDLSSKDEQGYDICVKRLASLGFQCVEQLDDSDSTIVKSVTLRHQHQDISYEFSNILHALQVVQFHEWRSSFSTYLQNMQDNTCDELNKVKRQRTSENTSTCAPHHEQSPKLSSHKFVVETMITPWENYMSILWLDLSRMLPAWLSTGALFSR